MICQVLTDLESGNHLVYQRTDEYMAFWNELVVALNTDGQCRTSRQKDLAYEYGRARMENESFSERLSAEQAGALKFVADKPEVMTFRPYQEYDPEDCSWSGSLMYSYDGLNWIDVQDAVVARIPFGTEEHPSVYLRGVNVNLEDSFTNPFGYGIGFCFAFSGSADVRCYGNVMNLLDFSKSLNEVPKRCFKGLFRGCRDLVHAPVLPAKHLSVQCYCEMFKDCSGLTVAPALPAVNLENHCYESMFAGCKSLIRAPSLPAECLYPGCYNLMFLDCLSLEAAPELPASALERDCYGSMFKNCCSLEETPSLSCNDDRYIRDFHCYDSMFNGCTSINSIGQVGFDSGIVSSLKESHPGIRFRSYRRKAAMLQEMMMLYTMGLDACAVSFLCRKNGVSYDNLYKDLHSVAQGNYEHFVLDKSFSHLSELTVINERKNSAGIRI